MIPILPVHHTVTSTVPSSQQHSKANRTNHCCFSAFQLRPSTFDRSHMHPAEEVLRPAISTKVLLQLYSALNVLARFFLLGVPSDNFPTHFGFYHCHPPNERPLAPEHITSISSVFGTVLFLHTTNAVVSTLLLPLYVFFLYLLFFGCSFCFSLLDFMFLIINCLYNECYSKVFLTCYFLFRRGHCEGQRLEHPSCGRGVGVALPHREAHEERPEAIVGRKLARRKSNRGVPESRVLSCTVSVKH